MLLVTLENDVPMTYDRLCCMARMIDYNVWQRGEVSTGQRKGVLDLLEEMRTSDCQPIFAQLDPAQRTASGILRKAMLDDVAGVIIDQLSFLHAEDTHRAAKRFEVVAEIMHRMKYLANEGVHQLPVILLSQMKREGISAAANCRSHHLDDFAQLGRDRTGLDLRLGNIKEVRHWSPRADERHRQLIPAHGGPRLRADLAAGDRPHPGQRDAAGAAMKATTEKPYYRVQDIWDDPLRRWRGRCGSVAMSSTTCGAGRRRWACSPIPICSNWPGPMPDLPGQISRGRRRERRPRGLRRVAQAALALAHRAADQLVSMKLHETAKGELRLRCTLPLGGRTDRIRCASLNYKKLKFNCPYRRRIGREVQGRGDDVIRSWPDKRCRCRRRNR